MKIGCMAGTTGPANMLKLYAGAAREVGLEVVEIYVTKSGELLERSHELGDCDVLFTSFGSLNASDELAVAFEQKNRGALLVQIEDVPLSSNRPAAKVIASEVDAVITALPVEDERLELEAFGYHPQALHYFGPPPHWRKSYEEMREAKPSLRSEFCERSDGVSKPLDPRKFIFYVPGFKFPDRTNKMLRMVRDAGKNLLGTNFVLGFKNHPGEKPRKPEEEEFFQAQFEERKDILAGVAMLEYTAELTNAYLAAVSDITVFSIGPTESIAAAYARVDRVAYYWDPWVQKILLETGIPGGKWFVAERQGALPVGPSSLEAGIGVLLTGWGRFYLRARQEENFPDLEDWDTVPKILKFVEEMTGAHNPT